MFIHCRNSRCKYYWEDSCQLNLEDKMVAFDEEGKCESSEKGVSEWYQSSNKCNLAEKTHDGKCRGYQESSVDDEPIEMCKQCELFELYEEDGERRNEE